MIGDEIVVYRHECDQHKPMDANRNGYTIGYTIRGRKGPAVTNVESTRRRPEPGNDARSTNHTNGGRDE